MVTLTPHRLTPAPKRVYLIRKPSKQRPVDGVNSGLTDKKHVSFKDDMVQVKLFYSWQTPQSVRDPPAANASDNIAHYLWTNWDNTTQHKNLQNEPIQCETVKMNADGTMTGSCRVANLAYEKHIIVRYTINNWRTHDDVDAEYRTSFGTWDRFVFNFKLSSHLPMDGSTLQFVLRYSVCDQVFWDTNHGASFMCSLKRDDKQHTNTFPACDPADAHFPKPNNPFSLQV